MSQHSCLGKIPVKKPAKPVHQQMMYACPPSLRHKPWTALLSSKAVCWRIGILSDASGYPLQYTTEPNLACSLANQ